MPKEELEEKLALLPARPGVYLMRDQEGRVIYVGKAASLKDRVRSYFQSPSQQGPRTRALVARIADLEYILTDSAVEALILENNLIKRYRPRYNIDLKDDKTYPYLKVSVQHPFPRLTVTRSRLQDGSRYFGPYTHVAAMRDTLRFLKKLFPLRTCTDRTLGAGRPCLNAHIRRCLAPCAGRISPEDYRALVRELILFLEGRQADLARDLRGRMEEAAGRMEFELAARLRDQLKWLEEVSARQKIVLEDQRDRDVVVLASGEGEACGQVFLVRGGKVVGREHFFLEGAAGAESSSLLAAFLQRYYSRVDFLPPEVLLSEEPEERQVIEEWLSGLRGARVRLAVPQRGPRKKLMELAQQNALLLLQGYVEAGRRREAAEEGALRELQDLFGLPAPPRRLECYDISHLQGTETVGSLAVFEEGRPRSDQYRRFRLRAVEGPDDFASLYEVLSRRFRHTAEKGEEGRFASTPDLVIIDGGRGQLSAARRAMQEQGASQIPLLALAKGEELIYQEDNPEPVRLPRDSEALKLLQRLRDEAHRFAVTYHRELRGKRQQGSALDGVPGVGAKRRRALLQRFGSVQGIREAAPEEIAAVPGLNSSLARAILEHLRQ